MELKQRLAQMDIRLIVDASLSMNKRQRFQNVTVAASSIAERFSEVDEDGIEIGVFGDGAQWLGQASSASDVHTLLSRFGAASDSKDMHAAVRLGAAGRDMEKNSIVFIISDGAPSSITATVEAVDDESRNLIAPAHNPRATTELNFVFVQLGIEDCAADWIQSLDEELVAQSLMYDNVGVKVVHEVRGNVLRKSIMDAILDFT